jgi:hypothetical protein
MGRMLEEHEESEECDESEEYRKMIERMLER